MALRLLGPVLVPLLAACSIKPDPAHLATLSIPIGEHCYVAAGKHAGCEGPVMDRNGDSYTLRRLACPVNDPKKPFVGNRITGGPVVIDKLTLMCDFVISALKANPPADFSKLPPPYHLAK